MYSIGKKKLTSNFGALYFYHQSAGSIRCDDNRRIESTYKQYTKNSVIHISEFFPSLCLHKRNIRYLLKHIEDNHYIQ